jgi:ATP-dependent Clp protease ATP-binding subunit ClpA
MPSFSSTLEAAIHNALGQANQRRHELATLEHLLLALVDEPDAARVMKACGVDLEKLRKTIIAFLDEELDALISDLPEAVWDCGFEGTRERGHYPRPSGQNPSAVGRRGQWTSVLPVTR